MTRRSLFASRPSAVHTHGDRSPFDRSQFSSPLSTLSVAVALALALGATDASALALGRINVQSALGEPLRAEVEVSDIAPGEADGLRINLASPQAFQAAGVAYNDALANIRTSLQRRADGRYVVRLNGTRALNEPFVDLLLEANWPSGRMVRDYTLLLDPPASTRQAAAPVAPTPPVVVRPQPRPAPAQPPIAVAPRPRPAAPIAVAPMPVPRPAPAPAPARSANPGEVTVRSGDTAGRIASAYRSGEVSLDQMLLALLQANPDAFINGNVNRLKAGAVLQIPSASEAAATPTVEARRTLRAQSRNFAEYRRRVAENAPASQVAAADRQASGRLQANVDDRNAAAGATDRLTITQGGAGAPGTRPEDQIAQNRQAQESNARSGEIQRNIEELNRLQGGAEQPAGTTPAATAPGTPAATPLPGAAPVPTAPAAPGLPGTAADGSTPGGTATPVTPAGTPPAAPATTPDTPTAAAPAEPAPVPAAPVAPPPPPPVAPPAPAPEPSLTDRLMENPIVPVGGLIALLLAGLLVYRMRNRNRVDTVDSVFPESRMTGDSFFGATGGESVDTKNNSRNNSIVSSLSYSPSQLDAGDVDPVAEADVYLAYGRDLQAEEILREALRTNPERTAIHLKLLEIHAKRRDLRAFESLALDLHKLTSGMGTDWGRAVDMGHELDPANPLYQGGTPSAADAAHAGPAAGPAAGPISTATLLGAAAAAPATAEAAPPAFVPTVAPLDFDLDLIKPVPTEPMPLTPNAPPSIVPPGWNDAPAPLAPRAPQAGYEPASAYEPTVRAPLGDLGHPAPMPIDNDFDTAPAELEPHTRGAGPADEERTHLATLRAGLPGDSGFIEFDMDTPSGEAAIDTRPSDLQTTRAALLDDGGTGDSPSAIKLSLARELYALGDTEGARSLAEEVATESTGTMRAQAQQLLAELD